MAGSPLQEQPTAARAVGDAGGSPADVLMWWIAMTGSPAQTIAKFFSLPFGVKESRLYDFPGLIYWAFRQVDLKCGTSAGSISNSSWRCRIAPLRALSFFGPELDVHRKAAKIAKTTFRTTITGQSILV